MNLSRSCFKLLKGSCEVQIHVEVVTRGKRGRERIATIERDANVACAPQILDQANAGASEYS